MTTNYHTALAVSDNLDIAEVNERFADLDAAIATQAAALEIQAALVYDSKTTTTDGGSASAATWNARDLNAEVDPDSIVTIDTNKFTPTSGTYMIWVEAPANDVASNRVRLYNVTQTAVVKEGINCSSAVSSTTSVATLFYVFSPNGTDEYRIDHYTQSAKATTGLGAAVSDGSAETYTQVLLLKIA